MINLEHKPGPQLCKMVWQKCGIYIYGIKTQQVQYFMINIMQ